MADYPLPMTTYTYTYTWGDGYAPREKVEMLGKPEDAPKLCIVLSNESSGSQAWKWQVFEKEKYDKAEAHERYAERLEFGFASTEYMATRNAKRWIRKWLRKRWGVKPAPKFKVPLLERIKNL